MQVLPSLCSEAAAASNVEITSNKAQLFCSVQLISDQSQNARIASRSDHI